MEKKEYQQLKNYLIIGIIFAAMTMLGGEIPIGYTVYPEVGNEVLAIFYGSGSLSLLQLASGAFFGGIGIPLQYYGYKAIAEIVEMGGSKKCSRLIDAGAKAIAFFGGSVHVLSVGLMFVCRMEQTHTLTELPQTALDFMLWIWIPISVLFMLIYMPMTIAMLIPVIKGKTIFPKWAIVFNPIMYKVLLNALAFVAPNTSLMNGIRMSNMGIGSLVTFTGLLTLLVKYYKRHI